MNPLYLSITIAVLTVIVATISATGKLSVNTNNRKKKKWWEKPTKLGWFFYLTSFMLVSSGVIQSVYEWDDGIKYNQKIDNLNNDVDSLLNITTSQDDYIGDLKSEILELRADGSRNTKSIIKNQKKPVPVNEEAKLTFAPESHFVKLNKDQDSLDIGVVIKNIGNIQARDIYNESTTVQDINGKYNIESDNRRIGNKNSVVNPYKVETDKIVIKYGLHTYKGNKITFNIKTYFYIKILYKSKGINKSIENIYEIEKNKLSEVNDGEYNSIEQVIKNKANFKLQ